MKSTGPRPSRRRFLELLATGLATAPLASRFLAVDEALGAELEEVALAVQSIPLPRALADRYLLDPGVLYMNHASIGTVPDVLLEAHTEYLRLCESNPWLYMWGDAWEAPREEVRKACAALLGCRPGSVAITHNTTEGFSLLARGLPLGPGDEVLFSSLNHPGASVAWHHAAEERGFTVRRFDFPVHRARELDAAGVLELYGGALSPRTRVLVFPHVDNAVGIRHPLEALARTAHEKGVEWVAVDGAQTAGMLPLEVEAAGVDFYSTSAHKWIQGPKGLGVLYIRSEIQEELRPMWVTWGQESWRGTVRIFEDYGTRALPAVLALGDALAFQRSLGQAAKSDRYREMHELLDARIDGAPGLEWRSPRAWRDGASLVAVEVRGRRSGALNEVLRREHGVIMRAFDSEALNTLRISPNVATTDEELHRLVELLEGAAGG